MADSSKVRLEEELTCPVCIDFFKDPVSLGCQHSFCGDCLRAVWDQWSERECPECRRRSSAENVQPFMSNVKLGSIVDAYLNRDGGEWNGAHVCRVHMKKVKHFCWECQALMCAACVETESKHTHLNVEEAATLCKNELQLLLKDLSDKVDLKEEKAVCERTAHYIKIQTQQTAAQIKSEFTKLHHFLRAEEEARLAALKHEEARKTGLLSERISSLASEMAALSEQISDLQEKMETDCITFLQIYKDIKERAQSMQSSEKAKSLTGNLINVAKHLGNLRYNVWVKMLGRVEYTPVTLDVNSAHPDLRISTVLTEVRDGQLSQQVPDNSERFDSSVSILGSESFCSGTHSWEVEVGPKKAWTLGVAKEGVPRKGNVSISPASGIWAMGLWNMEEYSAGTSPLGTPLKLRRKPQRVRIRVVYEKGEVCFFDPSDMSLIYKFEDRFEGPLYPYFSPSLNSDGSNPGNLKICPETVIVQVQST